MTKLSAKLASVALASAMTLSLFAVLPAHAADTTPEDSATAVVNESNAEESKPEDTTLKNSDGTTPIISVREPGDSQFKNFVIDWNYIVNLSENSSASDVQKAADVITSLGGAVLYQYPQLASLTFQGNTYGFGKKVAEELIKSGLIVHSLANTRDGFLKKSEKVLPDAEMFYTGEYVDAAQNDVKDAEHPGWEMQETGADKAWNVDVPRGKVTVGVLDSGIDSTHPDFAKALDKSRSVGCDVNGIPNQNESAWTDKNGHGTHVAGTIAAANDGKGMTGVNPDATIVAIRILDDRGHTYDEYEVCGIVWAAEHGVNIANNSWGGYVEDYTNSPSYEIVRRAYAYAQKKGVLNIASAGNKGLDLDHLDGVTVQPDDPYACISIFDDCFASTTFIKGAKSPQFPGTVVVSAAALPENGEPLKTPLVRSLFGNGRGSDYGVMKIDIAAPGTDIYSTYPKDRYNTLRGTSMATPHVTGVASLIKAIHPDYTAEQITALLKKHAAELYDQLSVTDGKEYRGAGLVNAYAAVTQDQPKPTLAPVEYSTDEGASWKPLEGAKVSGTIRVRAKATGPVTKLNVTSASLEASRSASGAFDGSASTVLTLDTATIAGDSGVVNVSAFGRNNDPVADDDVNLAVSFVVEHPSPVVSHTVTFDANGRGTAPAAVQVVDGQPVVKPADLSAEGYSFAGWFRDKDGSSAYDFSSAVTGDVTLYAKWVKNPEPDEKKDETNPTPSEKPKNKPDTANPTDASSDEYRNQGTPAESEQHDKSVKTSDPRTAKKAQKKLAQTGVNVVALATVMLMVLAIGGVLVTVRRH